MISWVMSKVNGTKSSPSSLSFPRLMDEILTDDESLRKTMLEDVLSNDQTDEAIIASHEYKAHLSRLDEMQNDGL